MQLLRLPESRPICRLPQGEAEPHLGNCNDAIGGSNLPTC